MNRISTKTFPTESGSSALNIIQLFNQASGTYSAIATSTDGQVDKFSIYRTDAQTATSDPVFRLLGRVNLDTEVVIDAVADDFLSSPIQVTDNYRLRNKSGADSLPIEIEEFKSRFWVTVQNEDTIYYSKTLNSEGASGLGIGEPFFSVFSC